jgi:hypothetical protein
VSWNNVVIVVLFAINFMLLINLLALVEITKVLREIRDELRKPK